MSSSSLSYRPIANALPLGLLAFGTTTAILSAGLCTIAENDRNAALTVGFAFGFGGVVQFLAGIIEFVRNNEFSATAFCVYGGFWLSYGIWKIMETTGVFIPERNSLSYYAAAWAISRSSYSFKRLKSTCPSRYSSPTSRSSSSSSPRRNKRAQIRFLMKFTGAGASGLLCLRLTPLLLNSPIPRMKRSLADGQLWRSRLRHCESR